jgi:hypothetical protein
MKGRPRGWARRTNAAAACLFLGFWSRADRAEGSLRRAVVHPVLVGAELGYALPVGSLESGSYTSDLVRGLVPFAIEGGYRLNPHVAIVLDAQFAIDIPKLCATAADCLSSLGHDFAVAVGGRFFLPRIGIVAPELRTTVGYEWFRAALSDNGVTSARDFRGPILASVQAFANLRPDGWSIGPLATLSSGIFSHRELDTPAGSSGAWVGQPTLHVWVFFGLRGALSF